MDYYFEMDESIDDIHEMIKDIYKDIGLISSWEYLYYQNIDGLVVNIAYKCFNNKCYTVGKWKEVVKYKLERIIGSKIDKPYYSIDKLIDDIINQKFEYKNKIIDFKKLFGKKSPMILRPFRKDIVLNLCFIFMMAFKILLLEIAPEDCKWVAAVISCSVLFIIMVLCEIKNIYLLCLMPFIVYVFDVFIGAMAVFISEHMWSQSIPFLIKLIKYDFIQILIIPILIINADLIKYKASQGNKKSTIE